MTTSEAVERYIRGFAPGCEQEERDREQMLKFWETCKDAFVRDNTVAHISASAWVVDPRREKALMIYHNIYNSWSWTGGHADGETDLLAVALREVQEETGVIARPVREKPFSIESLHVAPHMKRGKYVSAHVHMNVTFLLEADPDAPTRVKADENSGVLWVPFEEVCDRCTEESMKPIYGKLMNRVRELSA